MVMLRRTRHLHYSHLQIIKDELSNMSDKIKYFASRAELSFKPWAFS